MVNYYMKQKIFAISDKYKIYNEDNEVSYYCKSKIFTLTSKLRMYDSLESKELFYIRKRFFTILPKYDLYQNNKVVATVKRKFTILTKKLECNSIFGDLEIDGDFLGFNFSIYLNGENMCSISKKLFALSDCYQIQINDEENKEFYIALTILLDNCVHNREANAN